MSDDSDDSWQAFADGDYAEILEAHPVPSLEDDDWQKRHPGHHLIDMYVHRYSEVEGRSSPAEFWWGALTFFIVNSALGALALWLVTIPMFGFAALGWAILSAIPLITAAIRRLHDSGRGGARLLLWLIPLGFFYVVYVLTEPGDLRANEYGEPRMRHVGVGGKKVYRR